MKNRLFIGILFLLLIGTSRVAAQVVSGVFSVGADKKVVFSQGNLQYQASTNTWRFAEHQWDFVGDATHGTVYENGAKCNNAFISTTYSGWIDEFGWGTGNNPINTSTSNNNYNLFTDWGINPISNGGNVANFWRTLTKDEWLFMAHERPNADNLYGFGSINGINGLILLPDNWEASKIPSFTTGKGHGLTWNATNYTNSQNDNFSHNTFTEEDWEEMESHGAIFLPAAGYRRGTTEIGNLNSRGSCWTSTMYNSSWAYDCDFHSTCFSPQEYDNEKHFGQQVRLVHEVLTGDTAAVICDGETFTWYGNTYSQAGNYQHTFASSIPLVDSIVTLHLIVTPMPSLTVRPDTTIQAGDSVLLWATGADFLRWEPEGSITKDGEGAIYAHPQTTTTYTVTGYNISADRSGNLVVNGNFEQGNTGFTTDLVYCEPYTSHGFGYYTISTSSLAFSWTNQAIGYGGSGNLMIVDGATTPNAVVWQQEVSVIPHTYYAFSSQVMSLWSSNLEGQYALLQFSVNGTQLGPLFHSPNELYTWTQYYEVWFSGENTTVVLTILNQNNNGEGNDFALDEIHFEPLLTSCSDTKTVTISLPEAISVLPDNVKEMTCSVAPEPNAFEMELLFNCGSADSYQVNSMTTPLVADIDGDGVPEILGCKCRATWNPFFSDGFHVFDGQTGAYKYTIQTTSFSVCGQPVAIADVDKDGFGEIFVASDNHYAFCYDYQGNLMWQSPSSIQYDFVPQIADINNDGYAEAVFGKYIFDAETGVLLHTINMNETGMGWGAPHGESSIYERGYYLTSLADMDGDNTLELCAGNSIYKITLTNRTGTAGNSSITLRTAETRSDVPYYDGQTFVIDFDTDGDLDICVLGLPRYSYSNSHVYVWDGQTNAIIAHAAAPGRLAVPFAGDLNGDGKPEIVFCSLVAMSTYYYDETSVGNMHKLHEHTPFAETAGFTVFDFNQDGRNEIIYRGTDNMYIVDGETLDNLCTPIQSYSGTITEYPVVADVDGDGHAEILITRAPNKWTGTGNYAGSVSVFGSQTTGGWGSARKVWNQWPYSSVNINENLTVPQYQFNQATVFPNGKQPFNTFLAQKSIINTNGDVFVPAADVAVSNPSCEIQNDSIAIAFSYCNIGTNDLLAPYEITVYQDAYRDSVLFTDTVRQALSMGDCVQHTIRMSTRKSCEDHLGRVVVAINDGNQGIAQHGNQQSECDTTNNAVSVSIPALLNDTTRFNPIVCETELPYTHPESGLVFPAGTTSQTILSTTLTNRFGCDSVLQVTLTVNPVLYGDTAVSFCTGDPFKWHGVDYSTAGDYPYTYTSKVTGCDSIVTLHLSQLEPTDSIEYATICEGETYIWHSNTYTTSTDATEIIPNAVGCDSVCELHLIVNPKYNIDTAMLICDTLLPIMWREQTIKAAGIYQHIMTSAKGCDSIITLMVTVETCIRECDTLRASLHVPDICADDDSLYINVSYTQGLPATYTVMFEPNATNQGFSTSYQGKVQILSGSTATIAIPVPNNPANRQNYPRPNVYKIDVSLTDACNATATWTSQEFTIHYPSWIMLQRWEDVISLYNEQYNGGYTFSDIRWYHEGTLIDGQGEHNSYIYELPHLIFGDAYWAELTRADDGVTITTCPIYPVSLTDAPSVTADRRVIVTPTVITSRTPFLTVQTTMHGEYAIMSPNGQLLDREPFYPNEGNTFIIDTEQLHGAKGMCLLIFYGEGSTITIQRILIEE